MSWKFSPALARLRWEADTAYPNRPRGIDGTIGDEEHKKQGSASAHNPDAAGLVNAWDVTPWAALQTLIRVFCADPFGRAEYAIYNGVIWSRNHGFQPRQFLGDPHRSHAHLEVYGGAQSVDARPWGFWTPAEERPAPTFPGGRVLHLTRPYMTGDDVGYVQRFIGPRRCGVADKIYGPNTDRGVRWYQGMRGIPVTGIVDSITWTHLLNRA